VEVGLKIALFVCDCGTNIASVVDVPAVVSHGQTIPDVVLVEEGKWICSVDYLAKMKDLIQEHGIERVVVACCTPRTHEQIFKDTLKDAGLNQNMLEFVSIREQCSWVHKTEPVEATDKAKNLVEMGIAKARLLEPADTIQIPVGGTCLVVGGGIAGLTAASSLAEHGFKVVLVERSPELGGLLSKISKVAPTDQPPRSILEPLLESVTGSELIDIRTGTELTAVSGYVGNFRVQLKQDETTEELEAATIIIATGMEELEPAGLCGYGTHDNVMTLFEFEQMLKQHQHEGPDKFENINSIAVINCVNSRNETRGCCNIGCISAMKAIKSFRGVKPDSEIYLFHRDLIVPGPESAYLDEAQPNADALIRYQDDTLPEVQAGRNGQLNVRANDVLLEEDVEVKADLVVLVTAFKGDDSAEQLRKLLRVPVGQDNFYQEAHVKLKPVDFATDGIYLCGCAKSPKSVRDTIEEALGTAMRSAIPMKRGYVESEGLIAELDTEKCITCELCYETCSYGAVTVSQSAETAGGEGAPAEARTFSILEALCKGCGSCAAGCPEDALTIKNQTDEQIEAQIDAALADSPESKQLTFGCHWCALGAADLAGVSRLQYPTNVRIIRVMCSGRIDPTFIFSAFERGVPGVIVAGCEIPTCHYISGNIYAHYRMELSKKLLALAGIEPERLRTEWLSAAQGDRFAKAMRNFNESIESLGPVPKDVLEGLDLKAARACAESERLRLLVGKLPEMNSNGNRYGEQLSRHELNRILDAAVEDEFITQKILILLRRGGKSVKQLSEELGLEPSKIFRTVLMLVRENRVKRERIEGSSPIYIISEPEPEDAKVKDIKPMEGGVEAARA
jgi:heterodisulfide reductase subunit A